MLLDKAIALGRVDEWSGTLESPWTDAQRTQLADQLVDLAAFVEPHLVADVPIEPHQAQAYVLGRTVAHLEDWLVLAASRQRRALGVDAPRLNATVGGARVDLRSATGPEVEALPGVGPELADDVRRYLATHPETRELGALEAIRGIGPERVEQLRATSHLGTPLAALVSSAMFAFAMAPSIDRALTLLEASDIAFVYGDPAALGRRLDPANPGSFDRFSAFVAFVTDRARLTVSGSAGSLASEALQWLRRHEQRKRLLTETQAAPGRLLANDLYVNATKAKIDAATESVSLMVFLGTPTDGEPGQAPLPLVEALEHAAARGVDVRVIVDQDDGGEPYKSALINRRLVERLDATAVKVKFDAKDTLLHSKVVVVDRKSCTVGSHNWTRTAFTKTHELSVMLDSEPLASAFQDRFDALWGALPNRT